MNAETQSCIFRDVIFESTRLAIERPAIFPSLRLEKGGGGLNIRFIAVLLYFKQTGNSGFEAMTS